MENHDNYNNHHNIHLDTVNGSSGKRSVDDAHERRLRRSDISSLVMVVRDVSCPVLSP